MTRSQQIRSQQSARSARRHEPRTIGSWQIVSLLGEGRWTRVYRARPCEAAENCPADYAIKVLKDPTAGDSTGIDHLRREAFVGRSVSNPHLAPILSTHVEATPSYLVTPFLAGATIERLLEDGPLAVPKALWIARQAADALVALHEAGWLHGDVKPQNLILSPRGHATLIDLGFARRIEACRPQEEPLCGTMHYAAPEIYCPAQPLGQASDLYSLGVTLYRMLTGRLPFEQNDPEQLALAHMRQPPSEPRKLRPQLPTRVAWMLKRLLAKDPLRRPTASELCDLLPQLEIESLGEWNATVDS